MVLRRLGVFDNKNLYINEKIMAEIAFACFFCYYIMDYVCYMHHRILRDKVIFNGRANKQKDRI